MDELEKALNGYLYDANGPYFDNLRKRTIELCYDFNQCRPSEVEKRKAIFREIIREAKGDFDIATPFYCDYGKNITIGNNFYTNFNCVILDGNKVTFGDNVFIAPNCVFTTTGHPIDKEQRNLGLEVSYPITVGSNVWIGSNVTVLPGVTIGDNTVIGAGSIVNRDIPANVVAAGNPCKVIREITKEDRDYYFKDRTFDVEDY